MHYDAMAVKSDSGGTNCSENKNGADPKQCYLCMGIILACACRSEAQVSNFVYQDNLGNSATETHINIHNTVCTLTANSAHVSHGCINILF